MEDRSSEARRECFILIVQCVEQCLCCFNAFVRCQKMDEEREEEEEQEGEAAKKSEEDPLVAGFNYILNMKIWKLSQVSLLFCILNAAF